MPSKPPACGSGLENSHIRAKRRHPDGWKFASFSNFSDEVGACTVASVMTAPPHELANATIGRPPVWGISNDVSVSRRIDVS
jgi:hypothetical protein